jgi:hypothetical protein
MTIPTRAQLYEETDRRFRGQHPGAPYRLDPDDPAQARWVADWLAIRDRLLDDWTNHVFFEYFPTAGKLDPGDPADGALIEYWRDIQHQICTGESGRWSWDRPPIPPLEVLAIERHDRDGGFILVFSESVTPGQAGAYLWPNGVPFGAMLESRSSSAIHLRLNLDALREMREDIGRRITEAGILTAD